MVLHTVGPGKEHNSKSEIWLFLNTYCFWTIIKFWVIMNSGTVWNVQSPACLDSPDFTKLMSYFSFPVILFGFFSFFYSLPEFSLLGMLPLAQPYPSLLPLDLFPNATFPLKRLWPLEKGKVSTETSNIFLTALITITSQVIIQSIFLN